MLKYLFAFVFVALAWAAIFVFEELPVWPAWVATALVVGIFALRIAWRVLKARRSAGAIESALAASASKYGAAVRPELQGQVAAMKAEFEKALRSLKASKGGKHGASALAVLPWYVIIGPPGSGKSTLLRNSGLRFPYLSAKKGAVRGIGGTRNCDWWLSNDGILLDTAGRWSTEEEDTDEWLAFLDLLKKTRRGKAVNGVLVAVGADELLGTSEVGAAELAAQLRERLDELSARLGVSVPVYLLVTKCDLVGGFAETFGALSEKDRGQIWGFTLPFQAPPEEKGELVIERLDELLDALGAHALRRLPEERRFEDRQRIHQFPQEFEGLCPTIVTLVRELFAENVYADTPVLRGVYFTSGTQEGQPIDRVMKKMAEAFGVPSGPPPGRPARPRAYFLEQVFKQVIFPDQNAVGVTGKARSRQRLIHTGITVGSVGLAALFAVTPILAYSRNKALVEDARALADGLQAARPTGAGSLAPRKLESLAPLVDRFWDLATNGPPLPMTFGFYQGDDLAEPLARSIREQVIAPQAAADLRALALATNGKTLSLEDGLERLKRYLLLSGPRAADEPRTAARTWMERSGRPLRASLVESWRRERSADGQPPSELAVRTFDRLLELYLGPARENDDLWLSRDAAAVERARTALRAMSEVDPLLILTAGPETAEHDLSLGKILGGGIVLYREDAKVEGAYTRAGYDIVRSRLAALENGDPIGGSSEDAWVLGPRNALTKDQVAAVRARYFESFEKQWRALLAAVYPRAPTDLTDAQALLRRHNDDRPLTTLFRVLAENVELGSTVGAALTKQAQGLKDKLVERLGGQKGAGAAAIEKQRAKLARDPDVLKTKFAAPVAFGAPAAKEGAPPPLDAYYKQLVALQQAIAAHDESRDAKELRRQVTMAKQQIGDLIQRFGRDGWEPVLGKMLMPLVIGTEELVIGAGTEAANRAWCDAVVVQFEETLQRRYPFDPNGPDARMADLEKFFQPKSGILWAHYEDALRADVQQVGKRFRLADKAAVQYRKTLPEFLGKALRLTDLLFPKGGDKIALDVSVRLRSAAGSGGAADKVQLRVGGGKPIEYVNDAERWVTLPWPAAGAKLAVFGTLRGLPRERTADGEWALQRLVAAGMISGGRDAEEFLRAEWAMLPAQVSARMDLKPAELFTAWHDFALPTAIASGPSPCAETR